VYQEDSSRVEVAYIRVDYQRYPFMPGSSFSPLSILGISKLEMRNNIRL